MRAARLHLGTPGGQHERRPHEEAHRLDERPRNVQPEVEHSAGARHHEARDRRHHEGHRAKHVEPSDPPGRFPQPWPPKRGSQGRDRERAGDEEQNGAEDVGPPDVLVGLRRPEVVRERHERVVVEEETSGELRGSRQPALSWGRHAHGRARTRVCWRRSSTPVIPGLCACTKWQYDAEVKIDLTKKVMASAAAPTASTYAGSVPRAKQDAPSTKSQAMAEFRRAGSARTLNSRGRNAQRARPSDLPALIYLESGKRDPYMPTVTEIARAYGVSVEKLVEEE